MSDQNPNPNPNPTPRTLNLPSVSFEKQTKEALQSTGDAIAGDAKPITGTSGKHPISSAIGTALTGGKEMAGTKGYLAVCIPTNLLAIVRDRWLTR